MTRAAAAPAGKAGSARGGSGARSGSRGRGSATINYLQRSELPLTSLAFLLPLIVLYEIGTHYFTFDPVQQTEQRIIAFNLMQRFFLLFGASGRYMPGLAVVGILLAWHVARRDRWHVKPAHVIAMAFESLLLAVPLIIIGRVAERYVHYVPLAAPTSRRAAELFVLSLGAGVYEELVFRLIAFTVLSFLVLDILKLPRWSGSLLVVVISAALFSAYHYLGNEPFRWWTFSFRTLAGLYFGLVYVCRGFGITAGSHAAYDICIVSMRLVV